MGLETNAPLETETEENIKRESTSSNTTNNDNCNVENVSDSKTEELKTHSYYNLGFQNESGESHQRPTIEPSLSYTVDPKKYGIFLVNKSFDV